MASVEQLPDGQGEFTTGRGGIRIPVFERGDRPLHGYDVIKYFHKLWELNGFDPSTEAHYSQRRKPKEYAHELVLPAESDKPLVVIRGSFRPAPPEQIQRQKWENEILPAQSSTEVKTGWEQHQILVPPDSVGQFEERVAVAYTHSYGTSFGGASSFSDTVSVSVEGQSINKSDFYNYEDTAGALDLEAKRDAMEAGYSQALEQVIARAIDILS